MPRPALIRATVVSLLGLGVALALIVPPALFAAACKVIVAAVVTGILVMIARGG